MITLRIAMLSRPHPDPDPRHPSSPEPASPPTRSHLSRHRRAVAPRTRDTTDIRWSVYNVNINRSQVLRGAPPWKLASGFTQRQHGQPFYTDATHGTHHRVRRITASVSQPN